MKPYTDFEAVPAAQTNNGLWGNKIWLKAVWWMNILSALFAGWLLIGPLPIGVVTAACLCPLIAIAIAKTSGGRFALMRSDEPGRPGIPILFLFPGSLVAYRAFLDYNLVHIGDDFVKIAAGVAVLVAILVTLAWWADRDIATEALVMIACFWAYGASLEINALLDRSPGKIYPTKVINKQSSEGSRHSTYTVVLGPAGPFPNSYYLDVSRMTYQSVAIGQTVRIRVRDGALGISWCYLD